MGKSCFLQALGIEKNDVVAIAGAGGKTSLMFCLAEEAKGLGFKVLVTTSTKIFVPDSARYDQLDLSGTLFSGGAVRDCGIYVGGVPAPVAGKMTGAALDLLALRRKLFDLVLIEADGAAAKPLKGWNSTEPVIPLFTTKTIGVLDIQTIGRIIDVALVHRLEIFTGLTGGRVGDTVSLEHLARVVNHNQGLFTGAQGTKILYLNKVESAVDRSNVNRLRTRLQVKQKNLHIVAGSVRQGRIYG
jgi:probable selenium-dependent hydroxylase accessory protein YqeC